jgi:hypothetical protein
MNNLSGRKKFEKCGRKGYRSCPQYENPIMKKAIIEDIPESGVPIALRQPTSEDIEKASELCKGCNSFRSL